MTYYVPVLTLVDTATKIVLGGNNPDAEDHTTFCNDVIGERTSNDHCGD